MKKKLLIFSDCFTFGGSEYVVVNILKSKNIQAYFDLIFAYILLFKQGYYTRLYWNSPILQHSKTSFFRSFWAKTRFVIGFFQYFFSPLHVK